MPIRYGLKTAREPRGREVSTAYAFELLCAQCLKMDPHPAEITEKGVAEGWFHRMRMLANNLGWEIEIKIEDIKQ